MNRRPWRRTAARIASIARLARTARAAGVAAIVSTLLAGVAAPAQAAPAQATRSCHLPGSEEALRCATVTVPRNYAAPNGPSLGIHVTVAPAFREAARPDPLFILAGGPGEAGSDVLPLLNVALRRARATRDIVFIDQRGTGLSGKLDCPSRPHSETATEAELDAEVRACLATITVPLADYTTANAARDIERVRVALGYGAVNVWGGSYGTRLGQAYARAFPQAVRALVLDGVAAPEQVIPAGGRDGQAAIDTLFAQCRADAACNKAFPALAAEFAMLTEKVAGDGLRLSLADPRTAAPIQLTMNNTRFVSTVHSVLYSAQDSRRLPFLLHSAAQGRWEPFVARGNVSGDFAGDGNVSTILHLAVVCAEDVPRATPQLLADDSRDAFLNTARFQRLAALCAAAKIPAVPWQAPTRITAPVLMLSGALDPVTPPRRAEAAARAMENAQHLVVAHAGHGIAQLGCMPRLLREFLDRPQERVAASCLTEIPAASFQLGSAGPQP